MITHSRLKELFSYDPETGIFMNLQDSGKRKAGRVAGSKHIEGYVRIYADGISYLAHRLACLYMTGNFPSEQIDHINHIRNDNRWINLRMVGISENNRNRRASGRSSSGIPGVAWLGRRWSVCISDGKPIRLGLFDDLLSAACARKSAEVRLGYHENNGRP